jgi:hypothetical protein
MCIADNTVDDRPQDTITYFFALSDQAREWSGILTAEKFFNIKEMSDFLKRRESE